MRRFSDNDRLTLEPWRARAFPLIKDLVVDRSAFDRIIQAGGYTSINVGGAQDANAILISKNTVEQAMDSAACIGCGACVAACKNASAALFTSAKISHLGLLPQGQVERYTRVVGDGPPPRCRRVRQLLERRRMRSRLPEGNPDHQHRADEPGLFPRDAGDPGLTRRQSKDPAAALRPQSPSHIELPARLVVASGLQPEGCNRPRYLVNATVALRVLPPGPMAVTVAM